LKGKIAMKLYFSPGACSLAAHIALREAGIPFESERVDLREKLTASGADFNLVNPKGYVPALVLDNGEVVTENIAVLDYLATQDSALGIQGPLGRTRLLEGLAYISTELHKSFKPFFKGAGHAEKAETGAYITKRMQFLADRIHGNYLFGDHPSVAEFYLFVTLLWADKFAVAIPTPLAALRDRIKARPAVQTAMSAEGLIRAPVLTPVD
jgi:glutathione S-transferase